jgi:hypothetical protein
MKDMSKRRKSLKRDTGVIATGGAEVYHGQASEFVDDLETVRIGNRQLRFDELTPDARALLLYAVAERAWEQAAPGEESLEAHVGRGGVLERKEELLAAVCGMKHLHREVGHLAGTIMWTAEYEPPMLGEHDLNPETGDFGAWTSWADAREYLIDHLAALVRIQHDIDVQQWLDVPGRAEWVKARFARQECRVTNSQNPAVGLRLTRNDTE